MNGDETDQGHGNPRAFATATGFVFQIVGLVLAFGGCCVWSLSGYLQQELDTPVATVGEYFQAGGLRRIVVMIDVVATFICGIGLLATGLGLQGEKRSSGPWALGVSTALTVIWCGSLVALFFVPGGLGSIVVAACMAFISIVLFLLAGNSARILRAHPPPDGLSVVDSEFLENLDRRPRD